MGNCASQTDREEKSKSDAIDRLLEEDSKRFKKECKILLLGASSSLSLILNQPGWVGSGESGKSTIVKQMKIIHQNGYTSEELSTFRPVVYKNVLESAQAIVRAMRKLDLRPVQPPNQVLADKIRKYTLDSSDPVLSPEIAEAIHVLVQDSVVTKILNEHSSDFYLMDSAQ